MTARIPSTVHHVLVTIAIALTVSQSTVSAQDGVPVFPEGKKIEGAWNMRVTLVDCTTGDPLGGTGSSIVAFAQGGVFTEIAAGSAPSSRYPGLGVWKHVEARRYAGAFKYFRYGPAGTFAGKTVVNQDIEHEPNDTLNIAAVARFYDAAENLTLTRCVSTIGTRFTGAE